MDLFQQQFYVQLHLTQVKVPSQVDLSLFQVLHCISLYLLHHFNQGMSQAIKQPHPHFMTAQGHRPVFNAQVLRLVMTVQTHRLAVIIPLLHHVTTVLCHVRTATIAACFISVILVHCQVLRHVYYFLVLLIALTESSLRRATTVFLQIPVLHALLRFQAFSLNH